MPKSKTDNRTVEIRMGDKLYIQRDIVTSGIKLKSLFATNNEYGTNQLFQVLDEKQLGYIFLN